jgi:predicted dehydrogenase
MNLRALGVNRLSVSDPAAERRRALESKYAVTTYASSLEALSVENPTAVLICTPPHLHVELAIKALESGAHVFIEKPISNSMEGIDRLIEESHGRNRIIQVGYNWRFHDGLQKIKQLLDADSIGRVMWARAETGQYLPDWRPQLDYRQNYTAQHAMGGGIILDGSHELDYMRWLLGEVSQIYCRAGTLSDLEVDVEDTASIILTFESGIIGEIHLDFVQRARARNCKIVGTEGTIIWDHISGSLMKFLASNSSWESFVLDTDPNAKYLAEMDAFMKCATQGHTPIVDAESASSVLKLALGALKSAALGAPIKL